MEELKRLLRQTDDEYLIGLSNKGIVKRAYKDLEQESPKADWDNEGVQVSLGEVVCRIKAPLGESSCSCPSRSICRHVVAAILFLRQELRDTDTKHVDEGAEEKAFEEELLLLPLQKLKKACGIKRFRTFVERMRSGERPEIRVGSVITVQLPWEGAVVKLLSPFAYSTCSCHSKELCAHKAQAVLAFQLEKGAVTLEILQKLLEDGEGWKPEEMKSAAAVIKEGIRLQLKIGLSRLSGEAAESMERLAVVSHGVGLAEFESRFRETASWYRMYFERKAGFRVWILAEKLLDLYHRAILLERAGTQEEVFACAGSFRDTYRPVPRLHLVAMGERAFHSKTGYDGETYYFLEPEQGRWYNWTDVRPTFYEGVRRREAGRQAAAAAPWGMNCSREQMMELEFFLEHARATEDGRLSSSQETKAEIVGIRNLGQEELRKRVFWDYRRLLDLTEKEGEQLALVGAVRCKEGVFDQVRQRFVMELRDKRGQSITILVRYEGEEKLTIRVLERLCARIREQGERPLVFLGMPYVEQGRLCLYPVEYFTEDGICAREEEGRWSEIPAASKKTIERGRIIRGMEQFLEEIRTTLTDLFQSGLNSVREETLQDLKRLAQESESLGLHGAGEELGVLEGELSKKRHQMEFDPEPALMAWIRLNAYLKLCLKRTAVDQVLKNMEEETWEEGGEGHAE